MAMQWSISFAVNVLADIMLLRFVPGWETVLDITNPLSRFGDGFLTLEQEFRIRAVVGAMESIEECKAPTFFGWLGPSSDLAIFIREKGCYLHVSFALVPSRSLIPTYQGINSTTEWQLWWDGGDLNNMHLGPNARKFRKACRLDQDGMRKHFRKDISLCRDQLSEELVAEPDVLFDNA